MMCVCSFILRGRQSLSEEAHTATNRALANSRHGWDTLFKPRLTQKTQTSVRSAPPVAVQCRITL